MRDKVGHFRSPAASRPERGAATARKLLPHSRIELWTQASHAINGEYPERIAGIAHEFWDGAD